MYGKNHYNKKKKKEIQKNKNELSFICTRNVILSEYNSVIYLFFYLILWLHP